MPRECVEPSLVRRSQHGLLGEALILVGAILRRAPQAKPYESYKVCIRLKGPPRESIERPLAVDGRGNKDIIMVHLHADAPADS